jgi:hypothetical protein
MQGVEFMGFNSRFLFGVLFGGLILGFKYRGFILWFFIIMVLLIRTSSRSTNPNANSVSEIAIQHLIQIYNRIF